MTDVTGRVLKAAKPVLAAGILLAFTGNGIAAPADPAAGTVVDTAQDKLQRMTVDVFINGQGPFPFAVDTGAERTVISASLAQRLGLAPDRSAQLHSVSGVDLVSTTRIARLQVGTKQVADIQAPILADGNLGAVGLLGIDALEDQRVIMDFADNRMSIKPGAYREAQDKDTIVVTAKRKFGQLVLVDASIDGERVYAIVDSGAQTTIGNSALKRLLLRRKRGDQATTELIGVTGRSIAANYGVLPRMKIGSLTIGDIPVVYSDAHPFKKFGISNKPAMLLGADLLRVFERVSLDFNTKKVRFLLRSEESDASQIRLATIAAE